MRGIWLAAVALLGSAATLPGQIPARPPDRPLARAQWFQRFRQSQDGESPAQHRAESLQQARATFTLHRRLLAAPAGIGGTPIVLGGDWTELGPRPEVTSQYGNVAGRVTALAVDLGKDPTGNTVYVGAADGGLWLSTNALSAQPTFAPIGDNLPSLAIGSIALDDSTSPTTIYVGTGEANEAEDNYYSAGILKSTDGGKTWTTGGGLSFYGSAVGKLLIDPNNPQLLLAAVTESGAFVRDNDVVSTPAIGIARSSDGGVTWTLVLASASATDLVYDPANSSYYAAVRGFGIEQSTDAGQHWQEVGAPFGANGVSPDNFYRASLAQRAGVLYVLVSDSQGAPTSPADCNQSSSCSGVLESLDGGNSWGPLPAPANLFGGNQQGFYDQFIAAPPNSSLLVVGGIDVWSANLAAGVNWTNLTNSYGSGNVHPDEHAIAFLDAAHWYIGNDGGVWTTANAGTAWSNLNATLGTIQFYSVTPDPATAGRLLGGSQDNGTALGTGLSATQRSWNILLGGDGGHTAINPANPQQLFTENFNVSLQRSDDGGASFHDVVTDSTITDPSEFYVPYELGPQDPTTVYLASTRIWRGPASPATSGTDWKAISPDLTHPFGNQQIQDDLTALAVAPTSPDVIYAGAYDGTLSVTTNATAASPTWTDLGGNQGPVSALAVSPTDPNTVYVGMGFISSAAVLLKITNGASPIRVNIGGNLPGGPINAIVIDPANPNDIFVATDVGVFACSDGGSANEHWARVGDNLPAAAVLSLALTRAGGTPTLVAGTHGRGAWSIPAIAPPGFTMTVTPASLKVEQGQPVQFTVQTQAQNGASTVTLSCPQFNGCTFNPDSIPAGGSSTLTLNLANGLLQQTVWVEGDSDFATQSQSVSAAVLNFLFFLNQGGPFLFGSTASAAVAAGQAVNVPALVQFGGNTYDAPIQISCPQLPSGLNCTITPASIPSLTQNTNVAIQISAAATVAPGAYAVTVQAVGGTITQKATVNLSVTPFAITATPATVTATVGTAAQFTVAAQTWSNFTGSIALSCNFPNSTSGGCSFNPATITAGQTSVASVTGFPSSIAQTVIFSGTGGGSSATASAQVQGADFQIVAGFLNSASVIPGADSATFSVSSFATYGYGPAIALSCTNAAGLTCAFQPASITPGQVSQVTASGLAKLPPASYPITVVGNSGNLQHTTQISVANNADFSIAEYSSPSPALLGDPVSFVINDQFWLPVSVTCGQQPGLACTINKATLQAFTDVATVTASGWGTSGVPIVGTVSEQGATLTHTFMMPITTGDFTLSAMPTLVLQAGGTGNIDLTFTPTTFLTAKVNITCSGLPANAQCASLGPQTIGSGVTVIPFSITTTAAAAAMLPPATRDSPWPWALAGLLLLAAFFRRRQPLLAAMGLLLIASVACGGGGGGSQQSLPPPPQGVTSTITITATDATPGLANPVSHSTTVKLTIY